MHLRFATAAGGPGPRSSGHDVRFWEMALGPLDVPSGDPLPVSELTPADVQAASEPA